MSVFDIYFVCKYETLMKIGSLYSLWQTVETINKKKLYYVDVLIQLKVIKKGVT